MVKKLKEIRYLSFQRPRSTPAHNCRFPRVASLTTKGIEGLAINLQNGWLIIF
jgi:hypothetical protein